MENRSIGKKMMKHMTLQNIAYAVGGRLYMEEGTDNAYTQSAQAAGVVLDSRKVEPGFVFIAAKGERVDGHDFIESVFEKGAMGVICEKAPQGVRGSKGPYILVENSFQALKDLAEFYREQLDIKVIGITGSVGKTSTKEFVASVLSKRFQVCKTEGNYNNEVGLPLTVLTIRSDCEVAVLEMGISDFGEMHRLSKIAKPDVCVITNIGQCHLENLGTRDGILKAKTEIFDFMSKDGKICLNGDDDKLITVTDVAGKKPLFFGTDNTHMVYAADWQNKGLEGSTAMISVQGVNQRTFPVEIPLPGEHMVYNALAAAAVGFLFGLTTEQIQTGIADVKPVSGRSRVICTNKLTIIDDCYNANPVSMKAAIDLLAQTTDARRVAILGDMFELGADEEELHAEVGAYAAEKNIDVLICVGSLCKTMFEGAEKTNNTDCNIYYFADRESMIARLDHLICDGDTVLLKASHGMHFEELIEEIKKCCG